MSKLGKVIQQSRLLDSLYPFCRYLMGTKCRGRDGSPRSEKMKWIMAALTRLTINRLFHISKALRKDDG